VLRNEAGGVATDRRLCRVCGTCADVCLGEARALLGRQVSVAVVLGVVVGGGARLAEARAGLTVSGGEPLLQASFVAELLAAGKRRGMDTAVETCGLAPWEDFRRVLPHANTVFFDVKHTDSHVHRRLTGAGNDLILANLHRVAASGVRVIARAPLVPGCNADPQSIQSIARLVRYLGIPELHLLPYHRQGEAKYRALGRGYPLDGAVPLSDDVVDRLREVAEDVGGLRVVVEN
jgi:pyruvate formate lyase activating enzyme